LPRPRGIAGAISFGYPNFLYPPIRTDCDRAGHRASSDHDPMPHPT